MRDVYEVESARGMPGYDAGHTRCRNTQAPRTGNGQKVPLKPVGACENGLKGQEPEYFARRHSREILWLVLERQCQLWQPGLMELAQEFGVGRVIEIEWCDVAEWYCPLALG